MPRVKQITQGIHWCFTFNNYQVEHLELIAAKLTDLATRYVFQEELGESGTPHLQGYVKLKKRARPTQFALPKEIHWEKCRNPTASMDYCQKADTRNGKLFTYNVKINREVICIKKLHKWQQWVVDIVDKPADNRAIYWIWEPIGAVGKTELCRYLVMKHNALILSGKSSDMKFGIVKWLEEHNLDIVVFDIPRSMEKFVSYQGIEEAKNGIFFSGKYESSMCVYNPPHVFIFANFYPELDRFSQDRWHICTISDLEIIEMNKTTEL